jgi:hypothetical protein
VPVEEPVRVVPHADPGQRPNHHPPVGHDQHTADIEAHGIERRERRPVVLHPATFPAGRRRWQARMDPPDGVDL